MKTIVNTIPGYRVYEYLLVLSPHKELWDKIVKVKEEFAEKYQSDHARWGKPHVILVNFVQYELMEERIINSLKVIAMGYPPFKVEMKDFGSFPSHTIYINITSKIPVQGLVKKIRSETQRLMKLNDDNKPHFIIEPHLTIARKLLPWQYDPRCGTLCTRWRQNRQYHALRLLAGYKEASYHHRVDQGPH